MIVYVLKQWLGDNDTGFLFKNIGVTLSEDEAQKWLLNGRDTPDKNRDYDVFDVPEC